MGGMSAEREVSLTSGKAILDALLGLGYSALGVEADQELPRRLIDEKSRSPSSVFMAGWGKMGRSRVSWR